MGFTVQKEQRLHLVPLMQRENIPLYDKLCMYCFIFAGNLRVIYICISGIRYYSSIMHIPAYTV
jgi:hypothetical protein